MPTTEPASRDRERTRAAILVAAERLLSERGTGVALQEVAAAASVSKSGLLHHFPSKDVLLLAVAEQGLARLRSEVAAAVAPGDERPGRMLRAYVRALCGGSTTAMNFFAPSPLWNGLLAVPGIDGLLEEDGAHWRAVFAGDGLPLATALVVRHAAEGVAAAASLPGLLTEEELVVTREALLALTGA